MKFLKFPKLKILKFQKPASKDEWRQLEKTVAKILLYIVIAIMICPLVFWSGYYRLLGLAIDLLILFALYKALYRDIPIVHIGMPVSPFWGRIPEYLPEGKHRVLPWDKIELEPLKVKTHTVKEDKGYLTLDGAPISLVVDVFYRIDGNNIYLYKEVEGAETAAMEGKVKEYLYGMIGALDTDDVIEHQGEIARGIIDEIRLHPIVSKRKLLLALKKKYDFLKSEIDLESDEKEKRILTSRYNKIGVDIKALKETTEELIKREMADLRKEKIEEVQEEIAKMAKGHSQSQVNEIRIAKEKAINEIAEKELEKEVEDKITGAGEKTLSELEENFAIRILGSRIYGLDIADEDAKKGRSKRTTTNFERAAALTYWGTSDMIIERMKKKHPDLKDKELLEAVLINTGKIKKDIKEDKKVIEIAGLKEFLPEIAKVIFGKADKGGE